MGQHAMVQVTLGREGQNLHLSFIPPYLTSVIKRRDSKIKRMELGFMTFFSTLVEEEIYDVYYLIEEAMSSFFCPPSLC